MQGRIVDQFDHVKHERVIDDAEVDKATQDPLSMLKTEGISEDMQRVLQKLHTPAATQVCRSSQSYLLGAILPVTPFEIPNGR